MPLTLRRLALAVLLVLSFQIPARAQSKQAWPELSTFVKLNDQMRFYFLATTTKENRNSTDGEFGPNFDFYLKPLRQQKRWGLLPLDESKNRILMIRVGYRYLPTYAGDNPAEHRGILEATSRYPLMRGVLVSDRNRLDIRAIGGEYSWRYRNRLTVEREFASGRFRVGPYARAEIYYDSRFDKWSRTELTAGSVFPITKHFELEAYYAHQRDTSKSPNRTVNAVGTVVNLYF